MTSKGTYKTLKQSKLFEFAQISHASNHIGIKMSLDLTKHENTHVSYTKSMGDKVLKSILPGGHFLDFHMNTIKI